MLSSDMGWDEPTSHAETETAGPDVGTESTAFPISRGAFRLYRSQVTLSLTQLTQESPTKPT